MYLTEDKTKEILLVSLNAQRCFFAIATKEKINNRLTKYFCYSTRKCASTNILSKNIHLWLFALYFQTGANLRSLLSDSSALALLCLWAWSYRPLEALTWISSGKLSQELAA